MIEPSGVTEDVAADMADAVGQEGEAARRASLKERRFMLSAVCRDEALRDIRGAQAGGVSFLDGVTALLAGGPSARAGEPVGEGWRAIFAAWADPLTRHLDGIDADDMGRGGVLRLMRGDKAFHDAVLTALCEQDAATEPQARKAADIIGAYADEARQRFVLAGGDMPFLHGWTPLLHDAEKLFRAGPEVWQRELLPLLDTERTFGRDAADADRVRDVLSGMHAVLTLGGNPFLAGSGGAIAAPEHCRPLFFRSGRDAVAYNDRFGAGNLFDAVLLFLERMARAVALMERLGPNPEATVRGLLAEESARIQDDSALDPAARRKQCRELDAAMMRDADGPTGGLAVTLLDALAGEGRECVFPRRGKTASLLRVGRTLEQLGRKRMRPLEDAFSRARRLRCDGGTWPQAVGESVLRYLENWEDEAARRAAAGQAADFLDALTDSLAGGWDTGAHAVGFIQHARQWRLRWTGLDWITELGREACGLWLSRTFGKAADQTLDALPPDVRALLDRHGVDAARWDALRGMCAGDDAGRRCFLPLDVPPDAAKLETLLPEDLRGDAPPEPDRAARFVADKEAALARLRESVRADALRLLAAATDMFIGAPDTAPDPARDAGRGTPVGALWRFMARAKGFPVAYLRRIMDTPRWLREARPAAAEADRPCKMPAVVGLVMLAVSCGYAAALFRDCARGQAPHAFREETDWPEICLCSGAVGILGEFITGQVSLFGGKPALPGGQPVSEDRQNGCWWELSGIVTFALLNNVREWLSPGSLRRAGRRLKAAGDQGPFLPPGKLDA